MFSCWREKGHTISEYVVLQIMIKNDLTTATVVKMQAVVYTLVTTGICINSILNCWAISKFSSKSLGLR